MEQSDDAFVDFTTDGFNSDAYRDIDQRWAWDMTL